MMTAISRAIANQTPPVAELEQGEEVQRHGGGDDEESGSSGRPGAPSLDGPEADALSHRDVFAGA